MTSRDGLTIAQRKLLDESVHEIGLPVRTANHLEEISVFTVEELLNTEPAKLLAIPNFGAKTLKEVYELLAERGLYRRGHEPATPPPGSEPVKPKLDLKIPPPFKPRAHQFRQPKKKPKRKEG